MTPFLKLTALGDDDGAPLLINPNQIVRVYRENLTMQTMIETVTHTFAIEEPITEVMEMLFSREDRL